jgi:hypothetical protein
MFDVGRTFYDRRTRSIFVTNVTPQAPSPLAGTGQPRHAFVPARRLLRPGPLAGRYPAVATMVVLFLVPYLALSGALQPITPLIAS